MTPFAEDTLLTKAHHLPALWFVLGLAFVTLGCARDAPECDDETVADSILALLPMDDDWTDVGVVLDTGPPGSWDLIMEGITPSSIVRREDTYYLYYVGADEYIADLENVGPAHRAVGVAMSKDGLHWTKSDANPVLTFSSSGNPEEGAVSVSVLLDDDGRFLAFYGANIASDLRTSHVAADVRLATSRDGVWFEGDDIVIDHARRSVWGHGDEIHATFARKRDGSYYVYYVPNGSPQRGHLGCCWGTDPASLNDCAPVLGESGPARSRGSTSAVSLADDVVALFVCDRGEVAVHLAHPSCAKSFGAPVRSYRMGSNTVFMLDSERRTWFAYYNRWTHMGLKVAPAGPRDVSPPSPPLELTGHSARHDRVRLEWSAAADSQTGILSYEVFRDGEKIGDTSALSFEDSLLSERTSYTFAVSAVNLHGTGGPAATWTVRTGIDTTARAIETATAIPAGTVEGCIGVWSLDDATAPGTDTSGNGHHAAVVGRPRPVPGRVRGALTLGGQEYLEVEPSPVMRQAARGDFTVTAWVRPARVPPATDNTNAAYAIFSGPARIQLVYRSDQTFAAIAGGTRDATELASSRFPPGQWHHLALVVRSAQNTMQLYVDAQAARESSLALPDGILTLTERSPTHRRRRSRLRIGVHDPWLAVESHFFAGELDELRFFDRALTAAEVGALR